MSKQLFDPDQHYLFLNQYSFIAETNMLKFASNPTKNQFQISYQQNYIDQLEDAKKMQYGSGYDFYTSQQSYLKRCQVNNRYGGKYISNANNTLVRINEQKNEHNFHLPVKIKLLQESQEDDLKYSHHIEEFERTDRSHSAKSTQCKYLANSQTLQHLNATRFFKQQPKLQIKKTQNVQNVQMNATEKTPLYKNDELLHLKELSQRMLNGTPLKKIH